MESHGPVLREEERLSAEHQRSLSVIGPSVFCSGSSVSDRAKLLIRMSVSDGEYLSGVCSLEVFAYGWYEILFHSLEEYALWMA